MAPILIKHRGWVMVGVILFILLLEIIEHILILLYGEEIHLIYDSIIYILFFPTAIWLIISLLDHADSLRKQAAQANDLRYAFNEKIGNIQDWGKLTSLIVEYAHQVAPKAKATLFIYNSENMDLHPEAVCEPSGKVTLLFQSIPNPDSPAVDSLLADSLLADSLPVDSLPHRLIVGGDRQSLPVSDGVSTRLLDSKPLQPDNQDSLNRFDLQLARNDQPIGMIKLEYPSGFNPTTDEVNSLKSAEPMIALALEGLQLQKLAEQQAAYSESQRQQVAQNLHDSLAQNISYLRLKLDQLTGENAIHEINVVLQELERMRASADEAYQQVRNTLDELNPNRVDDLVTSLLKQARMICQRSSLTLRSSQIGAPYTLPPQLRQQIIYITREALHNIEKHAFAHQVHLQFIWLEKELILKITDDGVGFNPIAITAEGHYGLWIMQHRAEEIGGTLKINSLDMQEEGVSGTEVTLWVPRPSPVPGQSDQIN